MSETMERNAAGADYPPPIWRVFVTVLPKAGVNDPEGEAILGGLHGLGFDQVRAAWAGRLYMIEVAASSAAEATVQATSMAERLLANPVIQQYAVDRVERVDEAAR